MVPGMEIFKEYFAEYSDQYVLIGGSACDLEFDEIGQAFRPTKDIDMVLIVDALTVEFARAFWRFIKAGDYEPRKRVDGKVEFYRFVSPKNPGFPSMIELFSRPEMNIDFSSFGHLVPIHIDDEVSSLSAILLNDAYYGLMLSGKRMSDGLPVVDAVHLIPLKMKAWLDLTEQKRKGEHVNERDLRKHRQDVFRLFPLIDVDSVVPAPEEVHGDIRTFIAAIRYLPFETSNIGIPISKEEILSQYEVLYVLQED